MRALHTAALAIPLMLLAACGGAVSEGEGVQADREMVDAATDAAEAAGTASDSQDVADGVASRVVPLRLSVTPDRPSAAYVTLKGEGGARALVSVTSPDAERIEIHETRREGEMTMMRPLERIEVPADGEVVMRTGGIHLMIFGMAPSARAAESVDLDLTFETEEGRTRTRVRATTGPQLGVETAPADHSGHGEDHSGH